MKAVPSSSSSLPNSISVIVDSLPSWGDKIVKDRLIPGSGGRRQNGDVDRFVFRFFTAPKADDGKENEYIFLHSAFLVDVRNNRIIP